MCIIIVPLPEMAGDFFNKKSNDLIKIPAVVTGGNDYRPRYYYSVNVILYYFVSIDLWFLLT